MTHDEEQKLEKLLQTTHDALEASKTLSLSSTPTIVKLDVLKAEEASFKDALEETIKIKTGSRKKIIHELLVSKELLTLQLKREDHLPEYQSDMTKCALEGVNIRLSRMIEPYNRRTT